MISKSRHKAFYIDKHTNEVHIDGQKTKLTPKEMGVLILLDEHNGTTVNRSKLLVEVWGDKYSNNQGLTQAISRLREVFSKSKHISIRTIPKKGYLLNRHEYKPKRLNLGTIRINTKMVAVALLVLVIYMLVFVKSIQIRVDKAPQDTEESSLSQPKAMGN
ncbi:winged helix-turn-helix domain-containing protein [Roseivirga sp. E12]|uniref:winged helix-turn-helix domain-containing protein n=1 Tax=Roseivirga sp. E12 TaxID=2819237 RepID=UPI001ABC506B|nr:winged helix-turn-helix domain-containing protein [Roseivirga sp. E12]MBO3697268.1 winged helix-turn-helix domain-containing protein [Roseivirga sp. E12]